MAIETRNCATAFWEKTISNKASIAAAGFFPTNFMKRINFSVFIDPPLHGGIRPKSGYIEEKLQYNNCASS